MPRIDFDALPDHGRLWVFPLNRDLTDAETTEVLSQVDGFLEQWAAHGSPLESGRSVVDSRFLLIGVNEDAEAPSGCSIDALTRRLRELGDRLGVSLIDHAPVWYRGADSVRTVSRADFKRLASEGEVSLETPVFDTSLTRMDQLRSGAFEKPVAESWHRRAFFRTAGVPAAGSP